MGFLSIVQDLELYYQQKSASLTVADFGGERGVCIPCPEGTGTALLLLHAYLYYLQHSVYYTNYSNDPGVK